MFRYIFSNMKLVFCISNVLLMNQTYSVDFSAALIWSVHESFFLVYTWVAAGKHAMKIEAFIMWYLQANITAI